jgi:IclR family pca regulon transcriptional regulator
MGRVLLAGLGPDARAEALDELDLTPITDATIAERDALEHELDRVAGQGYALVDQELEVGLRSIAVPILDHDDTVIAAMNLSVHAGATGVADMRRRLLPPLRETAAAIRRDLCAARRRSA